MRAARAADRRAAAMRDAAQALTDAAAALVRDRERAASASSSSGLAEMLQQMRQLAEQQGQLNAQAQGLSLMPGGKKTGQGAGSAQQLADGERQVAKSLDNVGEGDGLAAARTHWRARLGRSPRRSIGPVSTPRPLCANRGCTIGYSTRATRSSRTNATAPESANRRRLPGATRSRRRTPRRWSSRDEIS